MKDGNQMPEIGLGTYKLKGEECRRSCEMGLELGYRHIDTAEMYENESEVGKAIEGIDRSELFITSKVWPTNLHYEDALKACENSLRRLGTSYLDLYLIHWPNSAVPIKETLQAMRELHEDDKVRSIGVSNFTVPQLEKAMEISEIPITANQVEFHPWLYQKELLEFCRENGVILTAHTPLGKGKIVNDEILGKLTEKYGKSTAQIALKWELQKGAVPLPRSTSRDHLRENIQLFDWELSPEDLRTIDEKTREKRLVTFHYGDF